MHTTKFWSWREDYSMMMAGIGCYSTFVSTPRRKRSQSTPWVNEDLLNMSSRVLQRSPTIVPDKRQHDQSSLSLPSTESLPTSSSSEVDSRKPIGELVNEIVTLELEVISLERYLLSLYRTAFEHYLASSPAVPTQASRLSLDFEASSVHKEPNADIVDKSIQNSQSCRTHTDWDLENKKAKNRKHAKKSPIRHSASYAENGICTLSNVDIDQDSTKSVSAHCSLVEHLGASLMDYIPDIPCRLSEEMIKCISAVYCKLSDPLIQPLEPVASPSTTASSSSTFSPQERDSWSPRCHYEATESPNLLESLKGKRCSYSATVEIPRISVEIPRISVDGDRFGYASKMLIHFRSLIQHLETVDPRKMSRIGQLAFWINIHNALIMHALLAYGLHENQMKSNYTILKAEYNVGGQTMNAYDIQNSILGCQPHLPTLWQRIFFSPSKFKKGSDKHPYALDCPEPLAHFALCTGVHSDPAVRVYTIKNITHELKLAKEEFIRTNVTIQKEKKILLPKLLYHYAKDASLELPDLLDIIQDCIPETQQKLIQGIRKGKPDKYVQWLPYNSTFRYLVHRDLANQQEQNLLS